MALSLVVSESGAGAGSATAAVVAALAGELSLGPSDQLQLSVLLKIHICFK